MNDEKEPYNYTKPTFARVSAAILIFLIFFMMGSCLVPLARSSTTNPRPNSLGLSQSYRNPYVYMVGTVVHVDAFSTATNVTFQPFGASVLDTETILFCGNFVNEFDGGLYLVAYRQRATRLYHSVACHDIYQIIQLENAK